MMNRLLSALLLGISGTVSAQSAATGPEAPESPPAAYQGETIEPEVTIRETEEGILYEYRVNGQLYMVRVEPPIGPPYYLLDIDGDGIPDVRKDRVWNTSVPQWLLHSW